ncbi:hypothetical protein IT415_00465 [bacterium]|nr:hypothetical protein [bacterium]
MLEKMLRQQPQDYRTLYIDMDSFFASAEQQRRAELRGKPVGVCPFVSDNGCIVAASREAKRMGVKTAMRVSEARRRVPGIILVRDTPQYYRAIHAEVLRILEATLCRLDVRGIDEMRLEIPSYMRTASQVEELIRYIKQSLRDRLGEVLTASIGIGSNGWQAKQAASFNKPDGLFVLRQSDLAEFYAQRKLIDCTGIRHRMSRRLYSMGIQSVLDLYHAPEPLLRKELGISGTKWYLRLRGFEVDQRPETLKKSIGHQTTLMPRPAETLADLEGMLVKMLLKVGYRLRATHRLARGMMISVRFIDGGGWSKAIRHMTPVASHAGLVAEMEQLTKPLGSRYRPVKKATIVTFDFVAEGQQSYLPLESDRQLALSRALDELRGRFGARAVMTGSGVSRDIFPDRIGFGAPERLLLPGD